MQFTFQVSVVSDSIPVDQSTYISLETHKKKKKPRRVLHFSDGVLEEYSTDEEEVGEEENKQLQPPIDPVGSIELTKN